MQSSRSLTLVTALRLCLCTSFLASALTPPASLAGQRPDSARLIFRVPDSIGVFALAGRKDYDDPSQGIMLRYRHPDGIDADVFLYPGPDFASNCALECARKVLGAEVEQFVAAFPELVRRHYMDTIAVVRDDTLAPPLGAAWLLGRRLGLTERRNGQPLSSEFVLFYLPGARVKVRATYAPDSAHGRAILGFANAFVPALVSSPATAASGPEEKHMSISVTIAESADAAFSQLLAALVKKGYGIADSSRAEGRLVSQPRYAWPAGSEKEKWHGSDSPGVVLLVTERPARDSIVVTIMGRSPVREGWKDTEVARQLELMSVLEVAAALSEARKKK